MKITYNFMKPILRITLIHSPFAILPFTNKQVPPNPIDPNGKIWVF